jgi:hypothetical protein
LKYTLKQVAETAIQAKDNPFRQKYMAMRTPVRNDGVTV